MPRGIDIRLRGGSSAPEKTSGARYSTVPLNELGVRARGSGPSPGG